MEVEPLKSTGTSFPLIKSSRTSIDKRARHEESQQAIKRQRLDGQEPVLPIYATQFSKEEIENEPKRPKRKVAVMMGYSGSGYKGMQLSVLSNSSRKSNDWS